MMGSDPGMSRIGLKDVIRTAFWSVFFVVAVNAILFAYSVATPLVANDSWYVLETFVERYYAYQLDITDFFAKRSISDHAQPVQKLIFLWHLRSFGLDFTIEALVGVAFALCAILAAFAYVPKVEMLGAKPSFGSAFGYFCCLIALPATILSISVSQVYSWSLVTLGFMLVPLALIFFHVGADVLVGKKPGWMLALVAFVTAVALDNLALIFLCGFVTVCALTAFLSREWKRCALSALYAATGCAFYDLLLQPALTPGTMGDSHGISGFEFFVGNMAEAWKLVWYPARLMTIAPEQLKSPTSMLALVAPVLAGLLILLHILFWIRAFDALRRKQPHAIAAAGMAISFYGVIMAIALSRAQINGYDYIMQPRYYVSYLLGLLPILMSGAWSFIPRESDESVFSRQLNRSYGVFVALLAVGLCAVQPSMALNSWESNKYISEYSRNAALQFGQLSDDPQSQLACVDIITICNTDPARKKRILLILERNQLNVFNPAFQMRHRLYPREQEAKVAP